MSFKRSPVASSGSRMAVYLAVSVLSAVVIPVKAKRVQHDVDEPELEEWQLISDEERYMYIGIAFVLVCLAGLFSGMTVGLLSIEFVSVRFVYVTSFSPIALKIQLMKSSTTEEKGRIHRVLGLVQRHHLLLVTLLLGNAICMEALPLFLDRIMPSFLAVLVSVTAVLFFGEILPQAFCTGKHQMTIASTLAPAVWFFIFFFFPIGFPLGKLLDHWLGHDEGEMYDKDHLKALIRIHGDDMASQSAVGELIRDEVNVIEGAMDLAQKKVEQAMVPFENVFALEIDSLLTREVLTEIVFSGHSRIPVYEGSRHNIRGLLLVKQLVLLDPSENAPVRDFVMSNPLVAHPEASLYDLLNEFQVGRSHIALVTESVEEYTDALEERRSVQGVSEGTASILGIITMEDVIEELIQEEILDEFDGGQAADLIYRNNPRLLRGPAVPLTASPSAHAVPLSAAGAAGGSGGGHLLTPALQEWGASLSSSPSTAGLLPSSLTPTTALSGTQLLQHSATTGTAAATAATGPAFGAPTRWAAADPTLLKDGGKTVAAQAVLQKLAAPAASAAVSGGVAAAIEATMHGPPLFTTIPTAAAGGGSLLPLSNQFSSTATSSFVTTTADATPSTGGGGLPLLRHPSVGGGISSRRVVAPIRSRPTEEFALLSETLHEGGYLAVGDGPIPQIAANLNNPLLHAVGGVSAVRAPSPYNPSARLARAGAAAAAAATHHHPHHQSVASPALHAATAPPISGTYMSQAASFNALSLTAAALNAAVASQQEQQQQRSSERRDTPSSSQQPSMGHVSSLHFSSTTGTAEGDAGDGA